MDWPSFITTAARIEPIAIVDAKSKLDIFANVRNPDIRVITIITPKIATIEISILTNIQKDGNIQFSITFTI
jgi:hypothetical protein